MRLDCYLSSHHAGRAVDINQGTVFQCKACNHVMIAKHWGLHCGQSEWLTPDKAAEMLGDEAHVVQDLPPPVWKKAFDVLVAQKASKPEPPEPEPEMDHCPTCGQLTLKSDIIGLPHAHAQCGECREEGERIRRDER